VGENFELDGTKKKKKGEKIIHNKSKPEGELGVRRA
jgi:hypothetical protein